MAKALFCDKCGARLSEGDAVCPQCGVKIEEPEVEANEASEVNTPSNSRKKREALLPSYVSRKRYFSEQCPMRVSWMIFAIWVVFIALTIADVIIVVSNISDFYSQSYQIHESAAILSGDTAIDVFVHAFSFLDVIVWIALSIGVKLLGLAVCYDKKILQSVVYFAASWFVFWIPDIAANIYQKLDFMQFTVTAEHLDRMRLGIYSDITASVIMLVLVIIINVEYLKHKKKGKLSREVESK